MESSRIPFFVFAMVLNKCGQTRQKAEISRIFRLFFCRLSLYSRKLRLIEPLIYSFCGDKLIMVSGFDYSAVVENYYLIRIACG